MTENANILKPPVVTAAGPRLSKIILFAVVVLYGVLLLFLSVQSPQGLYNSPDEMANAIFTQGILEDGRLSRPALFSDLPSSVAPRSMHRRGDVFIPVGFVSFPVLLGSLASMVGFGGLFVLLPIFAALALLAWYGFLKPIFGIRIAMLSAFLTAIHPMVLYWSERPLMPNIWFLSFVFFTLYFISRALRWPRLALPQDIRVGLETPLPQQSKVRWRLFSLLAGAAFGLAIVLRPQEGIWLFGIPLYLLAVRHLRKKISFLLFALAAIFPIGGVLFLQNTLYGSPIHTGYHLTPPGANIIEILQRIIIPFGVEVGRIADVVYNYWFAFVWWFALMVVIGVVLILLRKEDHILRRFRFWIGGVAVVGGWLILFYGSFIILDRFDGLPSIGTSFTRYFLPLYVMVIPLAAYALFRLHTRFGRILVSAIVPIGVVISLRLVFWGTDESVIRIPGVLAQNKEIQAQALEIIPEQAVVLTDRSDKIFFPHREVVTYFRKFHQPDFEKLYDLDLYYETIADQDVVDFENEYYWGPHKLKAVDPVDLGYRHTLYKLETL